MIATETMVSNKKFNVKFSMKRIETTLGTQSCGLELLESFVDEWNHSSSVNGSNLSEMKKTRSVRPSDGGKKLDLEYSKAQTPRQGCKRRGPQELLIECQQEKRQKMDRSLTTQCSTILKKLMTHPAGWVFNQPVDPVALNIPDYFSIISNPMDLGTIKSKLERNMYFGNEDFSADVRQTFSNAMVYNPPENRVHKMALELNNVFERRWKPLEEKWNCESSKVAQGKVSSGRMKEASDTRHDVHKAPALHKNLLVKSIPAIEKVKRSSDARDGELAKKAQNCTQKSSGKDFQKGIDHGIRLACGSADVEQPSRVLAQIPEKHGTVAGQCSLPGDARSASSSDASAERSLDIDHRIVGFDASRQEKSVSVSHTSKLYLDSDGTLSALDNENACLSYQPTPPATDASPEVFDVQLSPKKALRVSMLKSRFAETILKAQHKTLLDHGDKADPLKMQQEKEKLERKQCEERARIEAQMRVAEAASQIKEEAVLKQQRERERDAARAALHKIEKGVNLEENVWIQKELDMLLGCSVSRSRSLLEQLGLFIKDETMEDDDEVDLNVDGEEGEIFS